jgi:hypothetical protein
MRGIAYGSDLFGMIKKVDGTPIVTKFAMLQFLPIYPIESLYLIRLGPTQTSGVPLIHQRTEQAIHGLPLAKISRLSVCISYFRGTAAVALILGLLFWFAGPPGSAVKKIDRETEVAHRLLTVALLSYAVIVGGGSYGLTYVVPQREKSIRAACGSILGIAADPAFLNADASRHLLDQVNQLLLQHEIRDPKALLTRREPAASNASLLLTWVRAQIAAGNDREAMESATDYLLSVIELYSPSHRS